MPRNCIAGMETCSLLESLGGLFGGSEDTIFAFQSKSIILSWEKEVENGNQTEYVVFLFFSFEFCLRGEGGIDEVIYREGWGFCLLRGKGVWG